MNQPETETGRPWQLDAHGKWHVRIYPDMNRDGLYDGSPAQIVKEHLDATGCVEILFRNKHGPTKVKFDAVNRIWSWDYWELVGHQFEGEHIEGEYRETT